MRNNTSTQDKLEGIILEVIDNPSSPFMLYYADKASMNRTRVKLLQRRNRLSISTGGASEYVRISSEELDEATPAGYTHRITVSYTESLVPELIVKVSESGEISEYTPEEVVLPKVTALSEEATKKLDGKVANLIMEKGYETKEEVLAEFEGFKHKPTEYMLEKYFNKRARELTVRKTGMAEIERQLKMMSEDGLTREQASSVQGVTPKLLDKYFPEEEPSSE